VRYISEQIRLERIPVYSVFSGEKSTSRNVAIVTSRPEDPERACSFPTTAFCRARTYLSTDEPGSSRISIQFDVSSLRSASGARERSARGEGLKRSMQFFQRARRRATPAASRYRALETGSCACFVRYQFGARSPLDPSGANGH